VTATGSAPRARTAGRGPSAPLRRRTARGGILLAGLAVALLFLIPLLWMVSGAFKSDSEVTASPPHLLPRQLVPGNFADATIQIHFWAYAGNSLIVSALSIAGTLIVCVPAAYAFGILRWRGRQAVFGIVLFSMMLPFPAVMVPMYLIFKHMGMIGSLAPLIVPPFVGQFVTPYFSSALAIFLLRQFLMQLPYELIEAAQIDGAGHARILTRIVVPLIKPAIVTVTVLVGLSSWTAFVGPLIFLDQEQTFTLSLGLQQFQSQHFTAYNLLLAASTLFILPVAALFVFTQRYFTIGATRGSVK
jgi:multiple sugar transport system permease protein